MRIGFIVGKDDEIYDDEYLFDLTPKKYLANDNLHTDVAIAISIKESYPDVKVDIILPREISKSRLSKNDVNFLLGYDCINQMVSEPFVRKFSGPNGYNELKEIYSDPQSKVFPPINFLEFVWSKDKYLKSFHKKNIAISPTIVVEKYNTPNIIESIQKRGWEEFIIKPVGGTVAYGVQRFKLNDILKRPIELTEYLTETKTDMIEKGMLTEYFEENKDYYPKFLIQQLIKGFRKYGEIKMFWIQGEYSYAVNTIDRGEDDYQVKTVTNKKVLDECKNIGEQALNALPKIKVGKKTVNPVLVRTDFTCCMNNEKYSPSKYFLNEVEHQDAGSYVNNENIKYPYVQVMADAFVKKAHELKNLGF